MKTKKKEYNTVEIKGEFAQLLKDRKTNERGYLWNLKTKD